VQLLRGVPDSTPRVAFASNIKPLLGGQSLYSVHAGGFKLIWTLSEAWQVARTPTSEQLFDLTADPNELDELTATPSPPAVLAALRQLLGDWVERGGDASPIALDEEARAKLRSLGYL
jgi:arylsulfatase A-like enzyme